MSGELSGDILQRLTAVEAEQHHHREITRQIGEGVAKLVERSEKRDESIAALGFEVAGIKKSVCEMAPSVKVVRDGLIFVRWGRWIVGGIIAVLIGLAGAFDWIAGHMHLWPKK